MNSSRLRRSGAGFLAIYKDMLSPSALRTRKSKKNILVTIDGVTKTAYEWTKINGIKWKTAESRMRDAVKSKPTKKVWSIEDSVTIKSQRLK